MYAERLLQTTNQDIMVDAVERRTQVYKTEQHNIVAVGGGIDVGQDTQERSLG